MKQLMIFEDDKLIGKIAKHMVLHHGEPFATSRQIAKEYGVRHRDLTKQIRGLKLFDELIKERKIRPLIYTYRGQEFDYFELDEEVFILIVAKINTKRAEVATMNFIKAFRSILIESIASKAIADTNRSNTAWVEARQKGKATRHDLTDVIQVFCGYAEMQRGKPYPTLKKGFSCPYYKSITNLSYSALGLNKPKAGIDRRDVFTGRQIEKLDAIESGICETVLDLMEMGTEYHDIFKIVKKEIES